MEQFIATLLANPITLGLVIVLGLVILLLSAGLVWLGAASNKAHQLKRWHGAVLLIVYAAYLTYRLMN